MTANAVPGPAGRAGLAAMAGLALAAALAGCAQAPSSAPAAPAGPAPGAAPAAPQPGAVLGRNERLALYVPKEGDTWASIAERHIGQASAGWQVAEANPGRDAPVVGQPVIVPLKPLNPLGVLPDAVQTVPVLCYHRFGPGNSRMVVSPSSFEAQVEWLVNNGYQVIPLAQLAGFLDGRQPLPKKSVVITIDDGYESVHRHAFPVLKKYRVPATLFVYTDFVGSGDALSWAQLQEMQASGWVDMQAHSKTHRNLLDRLAGESDERYRQAIDVEARVPKEQLERRVAGAQVNQFAYPFGDANDIVLDTLTRQRYQIGVTVTPGGNAFFAQPLMLRRTMIFGDFDLDTFKAKLQIARPLAAAAP